MVSREIGRISAIHHHIDLWQKQDPTLSDRTGFIDYLETCDIGCHSVLDTEKWLSYLKESRKRKLTVAEVVFSHRSNLIGKDLSMEKNGDAHYHTRSMSSTPIRGVR